MAVLGLELMYWIRVEGATPKGWLCHKKNDAIVSEKNLTYILNCKTVNWVIPPTASEFHESTWLLILNNALYCWKTKSAFEDILWLWCCARILLVSIWRSTGPSPKIKPRTVSRSHCGKETHEFHSHALICSKWKLFQWDLFPNKYA